MQPTSSVVTVPLTQAPRRRPPPKLRTKTGCLTCRQRRKKCNEQRPTCDACSRNKLSCTWRTHDSIACTGVSLDTVQASCSPSSQVSGSSSEIIHGRLHSLRIGTSYEDRFLPLTYPWISPQTFFGPHSRNESHLLHHFLSHSLPTLISSHAHPIFKESSLMLLSTMGDNSARDALFAVSSLHLSNRLPEYGTQAMRYYSESVHQLREQVDNRSIHGFEDHLIMTVVWLYIFEIWQMRQGLPCHAGCHLKACMMILQLRKSSLAFCQRSLPTPWERIIAESVLFNSATTALFDPDLASLSVPKLRNILEPFLENLAIPDSSPLANSPVLGIPSEFFFTALEVSQLCYKVPLVPLDHVQALRLEERLGELQLQNWNDNDSFEEPHVMYKTHQAAQLYIIAAKVLLFKILRPNKLTLDPTLIADLTSAMDIIRDDLGETFCGQYFTWPVFVISCALNKDDIFGRELIRRAMEKVWSKSSSGNVIFVLQALDTISEKFAAGYELDTLDLLRCCANGRQPQFED